LIHFLEIFAFIFLFCKKFVKNLDKLDVRGVTYAYHSRLPKLQKMCPHAFGDFVL